jgi:hypothetical protein
MRSSGASSGARHVEEEEEKKKTGRIDAVNVVVVSREMGRVGGGLTVHMPIVFVCMVPPHKKR